MSFLGRASIRINIRVHGFWSSCTDVLGSRKHYLVFRNVLHSIFAIQLFSVQALFCPLPIIPTSLETQLPVCSDLKSITNEVQLEANTERARLVGNVFETCFQRSIGGIMSDSCFDKCQGDYLLWCQKHGSPTLQMQSCQCRALPTPYDVRNCDPALALLRTSRQTHTRSGISTLCTAVNRFRPNMFPSVNIGSNHAWSYDQSPQSNHPATPCVAALRVASRRKVRNPNAESATLRPRTAKPMLLKVKQVIK